MTRRILVTGASGFIGRHVVSALLREGHHVTTLGRGPVGAEGGQAHISADLLSPEADTALRGVDADTLVHLAWVTEHGAYWDAPENLDWVAASLRLLRQFAQNGGTRVLMAGTCAEYGSVYREGPVKETDELCPDTLYGICKDACRRAAEGFATSANLSLAWARLFMPYGPGEDRRRLIPSVIASLQAGEEARCSSGRQLRDFMYCEDVGDALATVAVGNLVGPVNIGTGEAVSVGAVVTMLAELIGRPELVKLGALADRTNEPHRLVADVARLRDISKPPKYNLNAGLVRYLEEYSSYYSVGQRYG